MARLKGPIPVVVGISAVVYAVVLLTEPSAPAARQNTRRSAAHTSSSANAVQQRHEAVRFARYQGRGRDAFTPGVTSDKPAALAAGLAPGGHGSTWSLTGISAVNGVPSALLENGTTHETAFVRQGEAWNGFVVAAIEPAAVVLTDGRGNRSRLGFADPQTEAATPAVAGAGAQQPGGRTVTTAQTLPAAPWAGAVTSGAVPSGAGQSGPGRGTN